LTVTSQKKTIDDESESRKKKRRWSARAENHADSLTGCGKAGAADANSVTTTTTTQHTITGGLELERGKPTWPGVGLVCGLELVQALTYNKDNTGRFGVGMTFLAHMDCV
jgi:hypothetical protein